MRHHQHQQLWVFLVAVLHAPSCVLVVLPFNNVGAPLVCVGAAAAVSVPERKDDFMAFVFTEGKDDQATLTRSHVGDDDGEEEDLFQPIWTLSSNDTTSTSVSKSTSTSTSVLPLDNRNHSNSNTTNHHHHHSKKQELEIDSSVVMAFVLCCVLAILYRKRRKLPGYWLQVVRPGQGMVLLHLSLSLLNLYTHLHSSLPLRPVSWRNRNITFVVAN